MPYSNEIVCLALVIVQFEKIARFFFAGDGQVRPETSSLKIFNQLACYRQSIFILVTQSYGYSGHNTTRFTSTLEIVKTRNGQCPRPATEIENRDVPIAL